MNIGEGHTILCQVDIGMLHQVVLFIDHWRLPAQQNNGITVVQHPHLVRGHKLPSGLLKILTVGAAAALALAACPNINGFLAQQLGNVLVGALLIAAQIDESIGIADDALPIVLEKRLQLADILQDDGGHDIPGTHGSLQPGVTVGERHIGKFVEEQTHRDGQAAAVNLIRLKVQFLKCLGIEHSHQEIEAGVVAVRDDTENSLLPLS